MAERLDCIVDGCHATIEEDSEAAVIERAEEHAREEHPEIELDEETVERIRSNIQTV